MATKHAAQAVRAAVTSVPGGRMSFPASSRTTSISRLSDTSQPLAQRSFSSTRHRREERASSSGPSRATDKGHAESRKTSFFNSTGWETAMGASAGVLLLGAAAMLYQSMYKKNVIRKMETAFKGGYDPALALVENSKEMAFVEISPPRPERELIDSIIQGTVSGRYYLILGSKGSGKTSMIIESMAKNHAEGVAFFEGHPDCEVTLDKFSESINYNMNRDYLGNLLGLSDLSGMSVFQSLERSLHKLEKALIHYAQRKGRPAVIILNQAHLLPQGEDGAKILHLFQQRAEKWAASGVATFVFTSNDYWIFDALRKNANRMDTLTMRDLNREQAIDCLHKCRAHYFGAEQAGKERAQGVFDVAYQTLGGRINLLNTLARRSDILRACDQLVEDDLQWLLSKTGIIEDHDDDVMDEQKWSTCSWLLFVELAKKQAALEKEQPIDLQFETTDAKKAEQGSDKDNEGHGRAHALTDPSQDKMPDVRGGDVPNPHLTWGEARQVMTRPDFLTALDQMNIIHVNRHHEIRADSMPLLRAFRRVAEQEGYEDKLERVMDRVSAIESLGRTRELVWKEQGEKGRFLLRHDSKGREIESWTLLGGDERLGRDEGGDGDKDD